MKKTIFSLYTAAAFFFTMPGITQAQTQQPATRVCLALLGDSSASVEGDRFVPISQSGETSEYGHMILGMAQALRDAGVTQAIIDNGPIAISYIEYSLNTLVRLNWDQLRTKEDINRFAKKLEELSREMKESTQTYTALQMVREYLRECPGRNTVTRDVIDLATDDQSELPFNLIETGTDIDVLLKSLRMNLARNNVTLNVLAMNTAKSTYIQKHGYSAFINYLQANVANGYVFDVYNNNYARAFRRKFTAEISGLSQPNRKAHNVFANHGAPAIMALNR